MQFEDVEYKVRNKKASSANPVKAMVSRVASHLKPDPDRYKQILKGIMGPSGSGKTTLLKIFGGRLMDNFNGKVTYNDIPYTQAVKRRLDIDSIEKHLIPYSVT